MVFPGIDELTPWNILHVPITLDHTSCLVETQKACGLRDCSRLPRLAGSKSQNSDLPGVFLLLADIRPWKPMVDLWHGLSMMLALMASDRSIPSGAKVSMWNDRLPVFWITGHSTKLRCKWLHTHVHDYITIWICYRNMYQFLYQFLRFFVFPKMHGMQVAWALHSWSCSTGSYSYRWYIAGTTIAVTPGTRYVSTVINY